MGIRRIPVIGIDYMSENEVKVAGWARIYVLKSYLDVDESGVVDHMKGLGEIEVRRVGGSLIVSVKGGDPEGIYRGIAFLEKSPVFISNIDRVIFSPTINYSKLRKIRSIVIVPPPLSKEKVIMAGISGKPFPPKSTRHITILKRIELRMRVKDLMGYR